MPSRSQLPLDFELGLTARYKRLEDCIASAALNHPRGMESVAGACDMSPSEFSRRLNAHLDAKAGDPNNRPLRVSDFVDVLQETQDFRPIYWLIERFLRDPEVQRTQAIQQLAQIMPMLKTLIEQAVPGKGKR